MDKYGVIVDIFDTEGQKIGVGRANIVDEKILFNPCVSMPEVYYLRESNTYGVMQKVEPKPKAVMDAVQENNKGCDLCWDFPAELNSVCHPTAPLKVVMISSDEFEFRCYVPKCNRLVAKIKGKIA